MRLFVKYATQWRTFKRSVKVASVVGTVLAVINHYDMFLSGVYPTRRCIQILVTYLVPFAVSTLSSALQGREMERRGTPDSRRCYVGSYPHSTPNASGDRSHLSSEKPRPGITSST